MTAVNYIVLLYVVCIVCNDWSSLNYLIHVLVGRVWFKKNYEELMIKGSSYVTMNSWVPSTSSL